MDRVITNAEAIVKTTRQAILNWDQPKEQEWVGLVHSLLDALEELLVYVYEETDYR